MPGLGSGIPDGGMEGEGDSRKISCKTHDQHENVVANPPPETQEKEKGKGKSK